MITRPKALINTDECPNMINGLRKGNGNKLIGGVGCAANRIVGEEHAENVTLCATVGLDGHKYPPQLIYARKTIDPGLFPRRGVDLHDCWVSVTEKGTQTQQSFTGFTKWLINHVRSCGVIGTLVWITDGHISRLSLPLVKWLKHNNVELFFLPPHSTTAHQTLDKLFKAWHHAYCEEVERYKIELNNRRVVINKKDFALLFGRAWSNWGSKDMVINGWRAVGISMAGLDPWAIPDKAFVTVPNDKPPALLPVESNTQLKEPSICTPGEQVGTQASSYRTRQQRYISELEYRVEQLERENGELRTLPPTIGEARLFAGADAALEAIKERANRKRKGYRPGMSGGMSMFGLEEMMEEEEHEKEEVARAKRARAEEREEKKKQAELAKLEKQQARAQAKLEREEQKMKLAEVKAATKAKREREKLERLALKNAKKAMAVEPTSLLAIAAP